MKQEFSLAESVIALSSASIPNQARTKGNTYIVTDIMYCSTTGEQLINIDNSIACGKSGYMTCGCGKKHLIGNKAYSYSSNFVSNTPEAIQNRLEEALNEEDYEVAILIRDIIQ
jgi:hypothetical protein